MHRASTHTCPWRVDLVVARCREQLLARIARLLVTRLRVRPACMRVLVLEECTKHAGAPRSLPQLDLRDQLLGVQRVAFQLQEARSATTERWRGTPLEHVAEESAGDGWQDLSEAYASWAKQSGNAGADAAVFVPRAWLELNTSSASCAVRGLIERATRQLSRGIKTTAAQALTVYPRGPQPQLPHCGNESGVDALHREQLGRAVLLLLLRSSAQLHPLDSSRSPLNSRSSSVAPNAVGVSRPQPVALRCLEPDFMQHNRQLLPDNDMAHRADACAPRVADEPSLAPRLEKVQHVAAACNVASLKAAQVRLRASGWFATLAQVRWYGEAGQGGEVCGGPCSSGARDRKSKVKRIATPPTQVLKPLMRTLRRGETILTPTLAGYAPSWCRRRDLSCLFQPLSTCDGVAPEALGKIKEIKARDMRFLRRESTSVHRWTGVVPGLGQGGRADESRPASSQQRGLQSGQESGLFWTVSQLLAFVSRPGPGLEAAIERSLRRTGLDSALAAGPVIGIHVRHGDACNWYELDRAARACLPLSAYIESIRGYARQFGASTIYLATDSRDVISDTRRYSGEFRFLFLRGVSRYKDNAPPLLWDERLRKKIKKNASSDWLHEEVILTSILKS